MNAPVRAVPELTGAYAYPRKNGELVFEAPWQSRAFGMVVGLHTAGLFPWDDFKTLLIEEVAAKSDRSPDASQYYHQWMRAFWRLLVAKKILSEAEMKARRDEFLSGHRQDVY